MSLEDATFSLRQVLPKPYWVSLNTIRRMEMRSEPDPVVVAALAKVYGVEACDLPEEISQQLESVRVLLLGGGASPGPEGDVAARPAIAFKSPFGESALDDAA